MTTLKIEQVSRTFPARHGNAPTRALEPTDLTIGNNDFVTILGPSGCGKSTLLRIVAGLDRPTGGRVVLDGREVTGPGADRGIIRRVLLPSSAPEIAEILLLVLGWAWTYVIVAELIGSSSGIGHMITDSQALLNTGQIIFGIIIIGLIGLVSDFLFKAFNAWLFPWRLA